MKQLDLFGNPVPVAQPKPRKKQKTHPVPPCEGGGADLAEFEVLPHREDLGGSAPSVSRSLRDLGIHGQEAAFYTAMRQATKMAPHSIRCVIDALAQYAATCLAEERPAKIPGLCTVTARPTAERTTHLTNINDGVAGQRTIPAHRKVKLKPAPDLVRLANAQREPGTLEFK